MNQPTPPTSKETLLEFPCDFTIKIFGLNSDAFESAVLMLIHQHFPNLADRAIQTRKSKEGKYCALSVTVHVKSKDELDRVYQALSSSPDVIMAL